MRKVTHVLWMICLSLSLATPLLAAEQRPKVGLVLGGGGAAGLAHVGVLKVLEEQGVPIDFIAGTSMGAIVGSLYAAGYSAGELEDIVNTLDWRGIFQDEQNRTEQSFQRKQDSASFFNTLELGIQDRSLRLPEGIITGQRLIFELRALLRRVEHIRHFDQLAIPFRAVATDIETGEAVVLTEGNLATAVRASMSIPGLFSPVTIDNRLLVDGYVSDNVPVSVVKDMGADIVIAVAIPYNFQDRDELNSAVAVMVQAMNFLNARSSLPQLENLHAPNLVIEPLVQDIGPLSFGRVSETLPIGEEAAREQIQGLQRIAALTGRHAQRRAVPALGEGAIIKRITLRNDSVLSDEVILNRMGIQAGQVFDVAALQRGLANVHGLGYFDLVDYELQRTPEGDYDLEIIARRRSTGDTRLRFGFALEDDFEGGSRYQLGLKHIRRGVTFNGAQWRNSAVIGDNLQLETAFINPLNTENTEFMEARAWHRRYDAYDYDGSRRSAEARVAEWGAQLDWATDYGNDAQLRGGGFYRHVSPSLKTGQFTSPNVDANYVTGLQFSYKIDSFDDIAFPSQGRLFSAQYTKGLGILGGAVSFDRLELANTGVWTQGKHRVLGHLELASNFSDEIYFTEQLTLGGHRRLSGLPNDQYRGNHLALASVDYTYELTNWPNVARVYAGGSLELGNAWDKQSDVSFNDLLTSGSVYLGFNSRFGPAFIGVGHTEDYDTRLFMQVGRRF